MALPFAVGVADGEHLRVTEFYELTDDGSRIVPKLEQTGRFVAGHVVNPGTWELRATGRDLRKTISIELEAGEVELVELTP